VNDVESDPAINDIKFCPHNEKLIGAACQDGSARLWQIPDGGLSQNIESASVVLSGHSKRLMLLDFHPYASNVLLTSAADNEVKLWDVSSPSSPQSELPKVHKGLVTSISWNADGSLLTTFSKDKFLRIFDPRQNKVVSEVASHQGAKSGKVCYMGDKLGSVGFTKSSEREIFLYDPRNMNNKLTTYKIDNSPSSPMPFWENDNSLLYLTGKGDGNVRIFEIVDTEPFIYFLTEFKSKDPSTGIAKLPRSVCNVMKCEITRFLKLTPTGQVIPIRFEVPRQNMNIFQDDLFPKTWDMNPSMTSADWFSGQNKAPNKISLEPK